MSPEKLTSIILRLSAKKGNSLMLIFFRKSVSEIFRIGVDPWKVLEKRKEG